MESEKVEQIIAATQPASTYSRVNSLSSLRHTAKKEDLLDFKRIPICHHRGGYVGNDVSIYYPGFHKFASQCKSITVDGDDCKFAHQLCLAMKDMYDSEDDRMKAFVELMNQYMNKKFSIAHKGDPHADFYIQGILYGEGKNEPGSTNNDPYREVISYYSGELRVMSRMSSAPSFLAEVSGASLTISGAVYGESVYVDRLVPPVWLVNEEMNSEFREQIVRTLKALKVAVDELDEYYKCLIQVDQPRFPCFQHYQSKDGVEMKIKYLKEIKPHLFKGVVDEKCVVIKYAERYSEAVHQLLADNGLAPELLATQQIGRFTAVVMVELENAINIEEFLIKHRDQKSELLLQCKKILEVLGAKNFVHGDLRPCNLLVSESQVYVTDFDWAGKENEVNYPLYLNHSEISWPHGASDGLKITSQHDKYWIEELEKV
jgi:hypothetical protein